MSKSDVGSYAYPASGSGSVTPHAVASIATGSGVLVDGVANPSFGYDATGNLICVYGAGGGSASPARSIAYTPFGMTAQIAQGAASAVSFAYDPGNARIQMTTQSGSTISTTTYLNDAASGAMEETLVSGSSTTWHDYILADGKIVAEKFSGATSSMRYFTLDHLGSVAVIADASGNVVERDAYDAWGKRRNADGSDDRNCALPAQSQTTRGFTNQEQIPAMCLVNLNARVYDPQLGRFMSADPTTEAIYNLQDLNRYTYVGNDPLSFGDPTGLCFLGCVWKTPEFAAVVEVAIAIFVPYAIYSFSFSGLAAAPRRATLRQSAPPALVGRPAALQAPNSQAETSFAARSPAAFRPRRWSRWEASSMDWKAQRPARRQSATSWARPSGSAFTAWWAGFRASSAKEVLDPDSWLAGLARLLTWHRQREMSWVTR